MSAGDSAATAGAASQSSPATAPPIARLIVAAPMPDISQFPAMSGRFSPGNVDASRHRTAYRARTRCSLHRIAPLQGAAQDQEDDDVRANGEPEEGRNRRMH